MRTQMAVISDVYVKRLNSWEWMIKQRVFLLENDINTGYVLFKWSAKGGVRGACNEH